MPGPSTNTEHTEIQRAAVAATRLRSASVERTQWLGETLGALLTPGDVVLLEGELGAGKTALTQGIGVGLGVRAVINSPTFTILKEYRGRLPLYHFDLYRIERPDEVFALGFEDYFLDEGVCVIEWAERGEAPDAATPWPPDYLRIRMRVDGRDSRLIEVTSAGPRGATIQANWSHAVLEEP